MPTFQNKTFASYFKNLLGINQTSNTGVDSTVRGVQDGAGNNTAIALSDDSLIVKPTNDDATGTFAVQTNGGDSVLAVDTANKKVLANGINATTQYAYFGVGASTLSAVAGTHYPIPFNNIGIATTITMGTSTNPSTSYDISANNDAHLMSMMLWYISDDITVDQVYWMAGGDAASGDTINIHLMSYDFDAGTGAGKGDLSNGTVVAGGADIASLGYENIIYQSISPSSADVDAGKVCMVTFESNGTNSDYSVNVKVKYHLR